MKKLLSAAAVMIALAAGARPDFVLPERLYAVPGVEMSVYWYNAFDALVPENYAFESKSDFGECLSECWRWTPGEKDAGTARKLVLRAWGEEGLVASVTTVVQVAFAPHDTGRTIRLAQLSASSANCLYQDQIFRRMRAAGWKNYLPVGDHSGPGVNCKDGCRVMPDWEKTGKYVPHDGFGGFTYGSFLNRWQMTADEFTELQAKGESDQMKAFGLSVFDHAPDWRKHLLKSPLLRLDEQGVPVLDIQNWFNRINGGRAPDVILVDLGGNGNFAQTPETLESYVRDVQLRDADRLVTALREAAPEAVIAMATRCLGCGDQNAFAVGGGLRPARHQVRKNFIYWNRVLIEYVKTKGDERLVLIPVSQCLDPIHGFPRELVPASAHTTNLVWRGSNALHPAPEGGRQIGDAFYSWLRVRLDTEAGLVPKTGADSTKVISYNIRHGEGMDDRIDLERIAEVIRREDPDFVTLQEVDVKTTRSGGVDQAAELGRLTGLKPYFAKAIDFQGGEYGVAILSKRQSIISRRYSLPSTEPRMLEICDFGRYYIGTVHLSVTSDAERLAQLKKIRETVATLARDKPVILTGDWNARPDSEVLKEIGSFMHILSDTTRPTYHGNDRRCLDYIAVDRAHADHITPKAAYTVDERMASDHAPVVLEF